MSYNEQYQKARQEGKIEQLTTTIYKFTEENEVLVGKLVEVRDFTEGDFDTKVNCYIMDTDIGRISTVLGSATDKQLDKAEIKDKVIAITYLGKKDLDDGKRVNLYRVEVL